jgi:hypothetical protein
MRRARLRLSRGYFRPVVAVGGGVVAAVVGGVVGGGAAVGSVATAGAVAVEVAGAFVLSFVSATNATARPMPASRATMASAATGARQFGVGHRRVRAAEPQSRHQSWSGATFAPQRGQAIAEARLRGGGGVEAGDRRRRTVGPDLATPAAPKRDA